MEFLLLQRNSSTRSKVYVKLFWLFLVVRTACTCMSKDTVVTMSCIICHQVFYLIFCRSVWHFPLRLDSQLYVEVVFNQIAPDYLEGLLLIMPGEQLDQDVIVSCYH